MNPELNAGPIECISQRVLGKDFLGPISASLLLPDLARRLLPVPVEAIPDRGDTLERAWEKAFLAETGRDTLRDTTLLQLSGTTQESHRPALFLNSTWVENGRRIVASNLALDSGESARLFARSNDLMRKLGHDLRLSSAAHNSARFPYVSPPGHWAVSNDKGKRVIAGRLQDGGLFDNFGAETALEILAAACDRFHCPGSVARKQNAARIVPVVILITSDPKLTWDLAASPKKSPKSLAYEIASTPRTYANTRTGRGAEAAARLEEWVNTPYLREKNQRADSTLGQNADRPPFFHFKMCQETRDTNRPPLGWALSDEAQAGIRSYLAGEDACAQENARALGRLAALITRLENANR